MHDKSKVLPEIDAVAEAWASIDGRLDQYRAGRDAATLEEDMKLGGSGVGYYCEAGELIRRIQERGFTVVAISEVRTLNEYVKQ